MSFRLGLGWVSWLLIGQTVGSIVAGAVGDARVAMGQLAVLAPLNHVPEHLLARGSADVEPASGDCAVGVPRHGISSVKVYIHRAVAAAVVLLGADADVVAARFDIICVMVRGARELIQERPAGEKTPTWGRFDRRLLTVISGDPQLTVRAEDAVLVYAIICQSVGDTRAISAQRRRAPLPTRDDSPEHPW